MNTEKMQLIWQYIILKHLRKPSLLGMALEIKSGPFKGMKYIPVANCSRLMPKIIGCYESVITPWILDIPSRKYDVIVDVGCAEGYYAVGFAYQNYAQRIYAFDIEEEALENARHLAAINQVEGKMCFEGLCDAAKISTLCEGGKALIFCDIEGGEDSLLDPNKIPMLRNVDLIVESHDFIVPGMVNKLIERFQGTHLIEIVGDGGVDLDKFPILKQFNKHIRRKMINEGRAPGMMWVRLTVK
ncbi:MAG: methyltransferase domain-containing protein [bacterium]